MLRLPLAAAAAFCICYLLPLRYGQQLVPVEDDGLLAYKPGPCMELLGFTARENVPRWCAADRQAGFHRWLV
jgi:hypothetical protein